MNLVSKSFLILKQLFFFVIYVLSFVFPRNKKIWLYGNYQGTFRDNSKYLFIYNNINYPEISHVWISSSKEVVNTINILGFKSLYRYSYLSFYYAFTAKVYIYNVVPTDILNGYCSGSAFLFNLWHGIPYKKIEYDIKMGPLKNFFHPVGFKEIFNRFLHEPDTFRKSTAVLTTSPKLLDIYSSAFRLSKDKICIGPYPRNWSLEFSRAKLIEFIKKYETKQFNQFISSLSNYTSVIIYMPTFREANPDFMEKAIPDFEKLHCVCKRENTLFLIKAHVLTKFSADLSAFTHIKSLDSQIDVYPLLPFTNCLVSDYSSIIFDYSLLRKKIIFYAFDKEKYLLKSREAYFSYEEIFTENYTKDFTSLLSEIGAINQQEQVYDYPLSSSFFDENTNMTDINKFIKKAIHY